MAIKIKKKYRVVEYALKNGYVRGQYHDMLGALNGFILVVQELGKEGIDLPLV